MAMTSLTAQVAALIRAVDAEGPAPVLGDGHARRWLPWPWRLVLAIRWLRFLVVERALLGRFDGGAGGVLTRARFCEEVLLGAMSRGVRQYVILGAGLDSFCVRRAELAAHLQVIEVDLAASQRAKLHALHRSGWTETNQVAFVATDFRDESVADAMHRGGLIAAEPCVVSWLGSAHYLSPDVVTATVDALRGALTTGSAVVVDVLEPSAREVGLARRLGGLLGEPLRGRLEPDDVIRLFGERGFRLVRHVHPSEAALWFTPAQASLIKPARHTHVLHLEKT